MILMNLTLAALLSASSLGVALPAAPAALPPAQHSGQYENVDVEWSAPALFVTGVPYEVQLTFTIPAEGASLPVWAFSSAVFNLDGEPLGARAEGPRVQYGGSAKLNLSFSISPELFAGVQSLALSCELAPGAEQLVQVAQPAPEGLDFMELPAEELGDYRVLMQTNRGDMLLEFWPHYAPNHVRNFLDLSYTGFYDGLVFHRVIPGFMIQGGDPTGTGRGGGPRQLAAEFSDPIARPDAKHVRGVLSMARSLDPNSATSQFFIMHGVNPGLDGEYSAFGKLVSGHEVVDKIVSTPRGAADKPQSNQVIERATVLRIGAAR